MHLQIQLWCLRSLSPGQVFNPDETIGMEISFPQVASPVQLACSRTDVPGIAKRGRVALDYLLNLLPSSAKLSPALLLRTGLRICCCM